MIALPTIIGAVGTSCQTRNPMMVAHRIDEYCNGASTETRAIASARAMHMKQNIETAPTRNISPMSNAGGVTHPHGIVAAPNDASADELPEHDRHPVGLPHPPGDGLAERERGRAHQRD